MRLLLSPVTRFSLPLRSLTLGSVRPQALALLAVLGLGMLVESPPASGQASGLVAAYTFNEGAGTTVADASGNNNVGTISGATWTTAGRFGGALVFNGTNARVTMPNAASLQLTTGMTLEAWVYPTATPTGWRSIVDKNVDRYYLMASSNPNNRPAVGGTWTAGKQQTMAPSALAINTWTHLAATFDGATVRLYVNGTLVASQAQTTPLASTTGTLQIGGNSYGEYFNGRIDEIRIYNRALTTGEIQSDMNTAVGATPVPDTTVPTVAITSPTSGAAYTTNVSPLTLGGTAGDNVGVTQVSWVNNRGGSGTASGATSWTASGITLQTGVNVLTMTARDAAGNTGTSILTVTYDPTAPTVSITAPTAGATYTASTSPLTLAGTAADAGSGVSQVTWGSDRGGSGTVTGTTSWSVAGIALQPGANVVTVTARDGAGNTATAILTVTYTAPDTVAPTVAVSTPTSGAAYTTNTSPLTLGGTAVDNVGVTQVTWANSAGGSGAATGTTNWTAAGITLQAGGNVLTMTARDAAGNTGTATLTVTYDSTAPTVSITTPAGGATVSGSVTVTANASDNLAVVGVQFLVDGAPLGAEATTAPYAVTWDTSGVASGTHTLSARARDAAGNTTTAATLSVTVANTQPTGLVAAYGFNEGVGTTLVDASGRNNTGTISGATWTNAGRFGGALVFNGTSAVVTVPNAPSLQLTTGMTLEAWVYPTATPTSWRAIIDKNVDRYYLMASSAPNNRPSVGGTWTGGNTNLAAPTALAINTWTHLATTFDGATVRLYVNGVQVASRAEPTALTSSTATLQIGGNNYLAEFFAGRIDEVRIYNRALTVAEIQTDMNTAVGATPAPDTTAPTVAITAPTAGATYTTTISPLTLGGTAGDNIGVTQVSWVNDRGGSGTATGTTAWTASGITLQTGANMLTVTARDAAGNTKTATLTATYTASDTTAPTISITGPSSGATYTTSASPLTLWGVAADNVGVAQVTWASDLGGSGTATGTTAWTASGIALQAGANVVTMTARDAVGNTSTATLTVTYTPDTAPPSGAMGPLTLLSTNTHFFADGTGRAVFLSGSHTWNSFQDMGKDAAPVAIDFDAYVAFLKSHGHNATILWRWDLPTNYNFNAGGTWQVAPWPWPRTGPGNASDGRPKFDLSSFDQSYFDRLRARVIALRQNGIYAIVELFMGEGLNSWRGSGDGFPLTGGNNINGIDDAGGNGSVTMVAPNAITDIEDAYVRKVIDTVNDLDNVLYEISEEGTTNATWWHGHMVDLIHTYEAGKPFQHPVGYATAASDSTLLNSTADWFAPLQATVWTASNCGTGTPACKVVINDSDHTYFGMWNDTAQGNRNFAWNNFTNGASVLFMDPYLVYYSTATSPSIGNRNLCANPVNGVCSGVDTRWNNLRDNLGYMVRYAAKMNLATMTPQPSLASTLQCLAHAVSSQAEYLVYQPNSGGFTVNLSATTQVLRVEWLNPSTGEVTVGTPVTGGSSAQLFTPPFSGDAVLYLVDSAGNGLPTDTTAPTVSITVPTAGATYTASTSPLMLGGTAGDNVGVTQVTWANDRGGSGTATGPTSWSASGIVLQPGTNILTVTARDAALNAGTATLTVTYTAPDATAPTVVITTPVSGATYTTNASPLTLAGTAADNVGVAQVTWTNDRGGSGPASGTTSWSAAGIVLQPGTNVLTVTARDAALNPGTAIVTVTYDASVPTASITAPGPGATVSGTTTVTATASDNIGVVGVQFLLDGTALGTEQSAAPFAMSWNTGGVANGAHTLSARARDAAGNTALAPNIAVTVANAQPLGLVAAYGFAEGAGTTVADSSGYNNTGTLSGATWTTAGRYGSALVFNGTNAVVTVPSAAALQLTTRMTLEAWVYPTATPSGWRAVIDKNVDRYYLMASAAPNSRPSVGGTWTAGSQNTVGPTALAVNTWTHLAATFDGAMVRLYVNGAQVASQAQTTPLTTSTATLQIGGNSYAGENFAGRIDEVRIYNRALSAAEIQTDMNTPVGGTPVPDTTPPTIALNSPTPGATVIGLVSVSAVAADDMAVSRVEFFVDGAPLGAGVTFPPYAVVWDTTGLSGSRVLTAKAWDIAGNNSTSVPVTVTVSTPTPSLVGQWSAVSTWPIVPVHATLLPTGQVLVSDAQGDGADARLWNPATNAFTAVPNTTTNIFCAGHCGLSDGRVLVVGGHVSSHVGLRDANIFNPATNAWTLVRPMNYARWYPTATALPDGRVLVTSGESNCDGCGVAIPEVYNPQTNTWTQLSGAPLLLPYYPHMFVLPDGRVLAASTSEDGIVTRVLNLTTQTWSIVDPTPLDGGSAAMFLPGQILKSGTSADPDLPTRPSAATTYVLDMTQPSPTWQETAPMALPRTYHILTLLPDGTVLATGGGMTTDAVDGSVGVGPAELWSPATRTWTALASLSVPRLYHSVALLLPDGRVLVAGGGRFFGVPDPSDRFNAQIFSPPYLFKGSRPTITLAPATASYNTTITVQTPDSAGIAAVSLIKFGSVTHAFNADQRFLPLAFTSVAGGLNIQVPSNTNLAPPGYYMLFLVDSNGVPSVASFLRLQ